MNSKKAITLLVLATLLMAIVPIVPVHAAVAATEAIYFQDTGSAINVKLVQYGDTMVVEGTGVSSGANIGVYWRNVNKETYSDGSGRLNTTEADQDGGFEIWFDVPEAPAGNHYVWVKDLSAGGYYGGAAAELLITGSSMVTVVPKLKVTPSSALVGDDVDIIGYGYSEEVDITTFTDNFTVGPTYSPTTPETDDKGTFTASFTVPAGNADAKYLIDAASATESDDVFFTVGPAITLNKNEGPSGTVVTISGRGFTAKAGISNGTITYNGEVCEILDDNVKVRDNTDKTFTVDIVIPSIAADLDEYEISVTESGAGVDKSATADFEILGKAEVEVTPEYGPVGTYVTVKGYNFTQISGEEVLVQLNGLGDKEFETNSRGEFTGTFRIPGAAGTNPLTAKQTTFGIEATTNFRVGFITVVLTPDEGPAGTEISVSGAGFDAADDWNATFGGDDWIDTTAVGVGGVISATQQAPTMEPGTYVIEITEEVSGISITVDYTITLNTYVETDPMVAPNEYNVTLMGYWFAENPADPTLDIVLYNATNEWDLDVTYGGVSVVLEADADWDDGYFEGYFAVPDDEEISVGTYTMNVTDGEGMFAQYTFQVVDKTVEIEPRKSIFRIGDTVAFNVESSFAQDDSYIKIYGPSGDLYWKTDDFLATEWIKVGTVELVPYYEQVAGGNPMTLLEDAPLGTWEWTWYDFEDEVLDEGTFSVEAAAADVIGEQVADLANDIMDLADQLNDVTSEFDDVKSDIADVAAIAQQAVTAAQQAAEAVQTVAQTANQANTAAENARTAAEAARDAANGLTTLVYGAIGAALVAALAAIVSLMQISRRIAG